MHASPGHVVCRLKPKSEPKASIMNPIPRFMFFGVYASLGALCYESQVLSLETFHGGPRHPNGRPAYTRSRGAYSARNRRM